MIASIALFFATPSLAQQPPRFKLDVSLYPYQQRVDSDSDFTSQLNARLSRKLAYFGFANFRGVVNSGSPGFMRAEHNLRWTLSDELPFDLNVQAIMVDGSNNDELQLGVSLRMSDMPLIGNLLDNLNVSYRMTWHLENYSDRDDGTWQIEHGINMSFPYLSDRLYLRGFADHTFNRRLPPGVPRNPIVSELQLGYRLAGQLHAVAEYRRNDFRSASSHNIAAGFEYRFTW